MKMDSGKIIVIAMAVALAAAAALGAIALRYTRHEDEFRTRELQSHLQTQCRLLAERCRAELETIRNDLERKAASVPPRPEQLRDLISREPFFVDGFIANRAGQLFYPAAETPWCTRYRELFSTLVSSRFPEANTYAYSNNQAHYGNILFHDGESSSLDFVAPGKEQSNEKIISSKPARTAKITSGRERAVKDLYERTPPAPASAPPQPVVLSQKAKAKNEVKAETPAPESKRMISRFSALTRDRKSGFIPWLSDNRYTPLVWAEHAELPDTIVGFEVESVVIWSRLLPLFPENVPPYFRFELVNAANRVIHAAGGELPEGTELDPVLVTAVSSELLPNAQLRALLIPAYLPAGSTRFGIWLAITALVLIVLTAGFAVLWLLRRELRLAGQKSSFVSQVSHELKTPLTSIRMYSELLQEHGPKLPEAKRGKYLQVLVDETERLTRLVNNVLDFSRLDNGRKRYNPDRVNLPELLESIAPVCRESLEAAGLELKLILPENSSAECVIDRDSLLQVLYNLLDNALKYAPDSPCLELKLIRNAGRWELRLRDYGPGIPGAAGEKIFQKFYRADTSLTGKTGGFGLGLSISRGLLRDQGGDLKFAAADPGAEFIIILPEDSL
jgi:signal transduction histidine kinase